MAKQQQNFVIAWTVTGQTIVRATDDRAAQAKFDKMDIHRLFRPRPTSPYGHPDSSYEFSQNGDAAPKGEV
jgi:hypothetical protein